MSSARKYANAKAAYEKALAKMQKARQELNAELIERRIAGKTNKELAAELGLTVNFVNQSTTVEYRKSGGRIRRPRSSDTRRGGVHA